ncbi:MAG: hypothetical protein ACIAQ0_02825 [Phycisphaerales bacterium JB058]
MRDGPEASLYPVLLEQYPASRFHCLFEVPYGRKRVDLVVVPKRQTDSWVVAIEFKVKDWRSALWQARLNSSIVHRSFVALRVDGVPAISKRALFERAGVGLIAIEVDESTAEVVIPAPNVSKRFTDEQIHSIWARHIELEVVGG